MGQYITAGLIGSSVTIIIQAIINAISDRIKHKRELRTMVFQRKLEVVEKVCHGIKKHSICIIYFKLH